MVVRYTDGQVHVLPIGDSTEHHPEESCVCCPAWILRDWGDGTCTAIIVHNAFDRRELDEPKRAGHSKSDD